jgi:hypothetical protein
MPIAAMHLLQSVNRLWKLTWTVAQDMLMEIPLEKGCIVVEQSEISNKYAMTK